MTLDELKQIKKDVSNGIVISRSSWLKVLDAAIENYPVKQTRPDPNARQKTPPFRPSITVEL